VNEVPKQENVPKEVFLCRKTTERRGLHLEQPLLMRRDRSMFH
jgi:hypothetical protein